MLIKSVFVQQFKKHKIKKTIPEHGCQNSAVTVAALATCLVPGDKIRKSAFFYFINVHAYLF